MKRLLLSCILLALFAVINTSCTKQDDADAFVGFYSTSAVVTSTWGGSTNTSTSNGTMTITKVSANQIQTSGWFNTYGEVVGNALYLESCSHNASDFIVTNVFGTGFINGNVLTFSCTTSGKILAHGTWYPYYSTSQHTCIKQQ